MAARGTPAGRRVRCEACGTLVEIPFVPVGSGPRRRNRPAVPGWALAGLGLVAAVVMVVAAIEFARSRGRSAREAEIASAVARAEREESSGRFAEALIEAESAVKIARSLGPSAIMAPKALRDRLALRESEADLAASQVAPDPVAALRALRARVEADPAREAVHDSVVDALTLAIGRRAESDLAEAARAVATGHLDAALALCEGVARLADELGFETAGGVRESARAIADGVIGRNGVVLAPIKGDFLPGLGSPRVHAAALHLLMAEALRRKGYFPRPAQSAFLDSWDDHAPYSLAIDVVERLDGTFFATPSNATRLNLHVALAKGPTMVWEARPFGKSRVPPPDMSPFEMSRLSLSRVHEPALEKRLYDDARVVLAENLAKAIQSLPAAKPAG